jgi:hypothetical protein
MKIQKKYEDGSELTVEGIAVAVGIAAIATYAWVRYDNWRNERKYGRCFR